MTFTYFLIYCLATWRISSLLVREDGPFFIFRKLRELTGIEHDEDGNIELLPENLWAGLLSCVWCTSVWVAFVWVIFWYLAPWSVWVAVWPALSAGAILLDAISAKQVF